MYMKNTHKRKYKKRAKRTKKNRKVGGLFGIPTIFSNKKTVSKSEVPLVNNNTPVNVSQKTDSNASPIDFIISNLPKSTTVNSALTFFGANQKEHSGDFKRIAKMFKTETTYTSNCYTLQQLKIPTNAYNLFKYKFINVILKYTEKRKDTGLHKLLFNYNYSSSTRYANRTYSELLYFMSIDFAFSIFYSYMNKDDENPIFSRERYSDISRIITACKGILQTRDVKLLVNDGTFKNMVKIKIENMKDDSYKNDTPPNPLGNNIIDTIMFSDDLKLTHMLSGGKSIHLKQLFGSFMKINFNESLTARSLSKITINNSDITNLLAGFYNNTLDNITICCFEIDFSKDFLSIMSNHINIIMNCIKDILSFARSPKQLIYRLENNSLFDFTYDKDGFYPDFIKHLSIIYNVETPLPPEITFDNLSNLGQKLTRDDLIELIPYMIEELSVNDLSKLSKIEKTKIQTKITEPNDMAISKYKDVVTEPEYKVFIELNIKQQNEKIKEQNEKIEQKNEMAKEQENTVFIATNIFRFLVMETQYYLLYLLYYKPTYTIINESKHGQKLEEFRTKNQNLYHEYAKNFEKHQLNVIGKEPSDVINKSFKLYRSSWTKYESYNSINELFKEFDLNKNIYDSICEFIKRKVIIEMNKSTDLDCSDIVEECIAELKNKELIFDIPPPPDEVIKPETV